MNQTKQVLCAETKIKEQIKLIRHVKRIFGTISAVIIELALLMMISSYYFIIPHLSTAQANTLSDNMFGLGILAIILLFIASLICYSADHTISKYKQQLTNLHTRIPALLISTKEK